jgi:arabinofuranosyltransferase
MSRKPSETAVGLAIAPLLGWLVLAGACAWILAAIIGDAWVCDDAYITFRVLDNLVEGHGLRWNVDERVEVYTHPLWLLIHVPFYALTRNAFLTTIAISIVCAALALVVAFRTVPARPLAAACTLVVPLGLSRAFTQYATSGLENPLSFLLFAVLGWLLVRGGDPLPWFRIGLVVGLALWNRLDTLFLYAPVLAYLVVTRRREVRWGALLGGLSPLLLWQVFRLLYYGFPYPNTKYAKLDGGIPMAEFLSHGWLYLQELALGDTSSAACLALGLGLAALLAVRLLRRPRRADAVLLAVAVGGFAYCGYVVYVGGDFMSGRLWSLPIFVSAWLLYAVVASSGPRPWLPLAIAAGLVGVQLAEPLLGPVYEAREWRSIVDERSFYRRSNALFRARGSMRRHAGGHPWVYQGLRLRLGVDPPFFKQGEVGMLGFYAGPKTTIVDPNGLTDALLARLPVKQVQGWRHGHLKRALPPGYLHARETGSLERMSPDLRAYYEKLRLITAGPVFDPERLGTIVAFNLGRYDHLRPTRAPYRP